MVNPQSEILDRVPPHDADAERWVIGSAIIAPETVAETFPIVKPESFYLPQNCVLWSHLSRMHAAGEAIDEGLLLRRLNEGHVLERAGGVEHIADAVRETPVAHHAVHYAKIVATHHKRRRVIETALDILRESWNDGSDPDELLSEAERKLQAVATGAHAGEPRELSAVVVDAVRWIDAIKNRQRTAGLMTGMEHFDAEVGGLFPGELAILAARPSIGKTALATQIAEHNGRRGRLVYFASLEMASTQLCLRMLCGAAGVSSRVVRTGSINDREESLLAEASNELGAATVWLHDRPGLNCFEVRRCARRLKPRGLSLVVVDYLQRVTPDDRRAPRHLQVGQISGALKELARELEVPVLCLCQLSRAAEVVDKQGKIQRPRMSMLKESGDIEQDADMVLLLHRADVKSTEAELIVGKNRNGQVGQVFGLQWDGLRTRYARPLTATHAEFDAYSGQ